MKSEGPVILAAFANDHSDQARFLRNLSTEAQRIQKVLEPAQELCPLVLLPGAKLEDILDAFQKYRDRIVVFHYAGHANGFQLLLESASGGVHRIGAKGLASFLGQQQGLQLVFLNGCSTERQAEDLLAAGVGCVIATTQAIDDAVATDFSARFYKGIVTGAPLQAAYSEAVGAAQAFSGGSIDRLLVPLEGEEEVPHETGRWPWLLKLRPGAERVAQWSLPEAAGDPLFGLPPVKPRDLPESPYRHLYRFEEQHAEVFFGRGHEIRELYQRVTAPDSPPVVLFYGPAGVGKSSLLDAGLIPRLEGKNEVRYERREPTLGLGNSLRLAFPMEFRKLSRRDAWIEAEKQLGRPLVIVLDQVEEAFTKPNPQQPHELEEFAQLLRRIFFSAENRPQGRLILGFRKEWFAEIDERLADAQVPRSRIFLERLCRDGAIEAITGPVDDPRLASHYKLTVEDGLPEVIADDLLADPDTPVAPTLQILLTRMWSEACRRNREKPTFDAELYQSLHRDGILLDDFLKQQTELIRAQLPRAVDSGFLLDLLEFHTTAIGTSAEHPVSLLEQTYSEQSKSGLLDKALKLCEEAYLLTFSSQPSEDGKVHRSSRLLHDTLAPLIRARHEESDLPGQRARRILDNRIVDWAEGKTGIPLDAKDLKEVEAALEGTRSWSAAELHLVTASRELRASNRRWRRIFQGLGLAAVLLIGVLGGVAYLYRGDAEKKRLELVQLDKDIQTKTQELRNIEARSIGRLATNARDFDRDYLVAAHQFAAAAAKANDPRLASAMRFSGAKCLTGLKLEKTNNTNAGHFNEAWVQPDGTLCSYVAASDANSSWVNINAPTPHPPGSIFLHGEFRTAKFSPDLDRCVIACTERIEMRNLAQNRVECGHLNFGEVRVSRDASVAVTWGERGAMVIEDPTRQVAPVTLVSKPVIVARISATGNRILTWTSGEVPQLWSRDSGTPWAPKPLHKETQALIWDSRLSPEFLSDTEQLVLWGVQSDKSVHAWNFSRDSSFRHHVRCDPSADHRVGWTSVVDPSKMAFSLWSGNGHVWQWSVPEISEPHDPVRPDQPPSNHVGTAIAGFSTSSTGQVALWTDDDPPTLRIGSIQELKDFRGMEIPHSQAIREAEFSQDGSKLLVWTAKVVVPPGQSFTGGDNPPGTARVWETRFGQPLTAPLKLEGALRGARWAPGDESFVVWGVNGQVQAWKIQTHDLEQQGADQPVADSDLLNDTESVESSKYTVQAEDGRVQFTDKQKSETMVLFRQIPAKGVQQLNATTVLEWGGANGAGYAAFWKVDSPNLFLRTFRHEQPVMHAEISPDRQRLLTTTPVGVATASTAIIARLWDVETGLELMEPIKIHAGNKASFKTRDSILDGLTEHRYRLDSAPELIQADPRWDVILRTQTYSESGVLIPLSEEEFADLQKQLEGKGSGQWPTVEKWWGQVSHGRNRFRQTTY